MKRFCKKLLSILLVLGLLLSLSAAAFAATPETKLSAALDKTVDFIYKTVNAPQFGSIGGEWAVIGLARSEYELPKEYWEEYYEGIEDYVKKCKGVLHKRKYTEYSRLILALTSIGADPGNVAGYNLLTPLGDFDMTIWQGVNGPIWALIALDSGNYEIPFNSEAKTQATRQMYVDEILSCQLSDGGWNLSGPGLSSKSDPDVTAMALQALAKYQSQAAVKNATEKALDCLSRMQDANGAYTSWQTSNSESIVQVIVALCELDIDINDPRFVKNGHGLLDNLLGYQQADGGFAHAASGGGTDLMASEQALYALVAAMRAAEGKSSLYRMVENNDASGDDEGNTMIGLPGKHTDVKKRPIIAPEKSFPDIEGHENQAAIEALIARGIINGMGDDSYAPDMTMTRAQFATIIVKSLGLSPKAVNVFTDVAASEWYAAYIGTAYSYGIVNGRSANTFDPEGTITRQEAAAMVCRAARLCGMNTQMESDAIKELLSAFSDSESISEWARESMAFCYSVTILDMGDVMAEPLRPILRCEIAQMLYNMLAKAELL